MTPKNPSPKLLTLLNCHNLEDFPVHLQGDQARSLLACWTAPWHPALLHAAAQLPTWVRPDQLTDLPADTILLVPLPTPAQPTTSAPDVNSANTNWLVGPTTRAAIWEQLGLSHPHAPNPFAEVAADDFAALGYAYLQLQLLTRRLRYSETLDEGQFGQRVLDAAAAFLAADPTTALGQLRAAHDLLLAERNRYYPVDAQLVELVLTDRDHPPTSPFPPPRKVNLLLPLEAARQWQSQRPELVGQLAAAAQAGQVQLLGSTLHLLPEPQLATALLLAEYLGGRECFAQLFGLPPTVFGRRQGSFHPSQPQILASLGYRGALHLPLSPICRLPPAAAATLGWQGLGQQTIDAIAASPLPATDPANFLGLALEVGQQIDSAHQATVVIAHWPGATSEPFDDLVRVARLSPLLGRFVTCDELFDALYHPCYGDRYDYDDYRSQDLSDAVAQGRCNPISTSVEFQRLQAEWLTLRHATTLLAPFAPETAAIDRELTASLTEIGPLASPPNAAELPAWQATRERLVAQFGGLRQKLETAATSALSEPAPASSPPAVTLLNAHFAPQRVRHLFPPAPVAELPPVTPPVLLVERGPAAAIGATHDGGQIAALVDLPASGLATAPRRGGRPGRTPPPMVVGQTLRNEYFELEIDPLSGAIRRLSPHGSRHNACSQRLALRLDPDGESPDDPQAGYARMAADSIEFDPSQPLRAICLARGLLVANDQAWARFEQRLVVTRGLRTIELDIAIELLRPLDSRPWNQYVCSRLAVSDPPLARSRGLHDTHQAVRLERFLAPNYVHIDNGDLPLTLFGDGLPWHRQSNLRILDTLLVVAGESATRFHLGIGIGIDSPQIAASQRGGTVFSLPGRGGARRERLFHLASRNLLVVDSWPTWAESGSCSGAILRLREALGESGRATLHAPRSLRGARWLDLAGNPLSAIPVADDQVILEYHEFKLMTLQLYW